MINENNTKSVIIKDNYVFYDIQYLLKADEADEVDGRL